MRPAVIKSVSQAADAGISETGEGTGACPFYSEPTSMIYMSTAQPVEDMEVDDPYSCSVAKSKTGYWKLGYCWTKEEEKERRKTSTETAGKAEVEERGKGITESGEDVGTRPFYLDTSSSSCMGPGQHVEDWEMEDLCSCSLAVPESGEAPIHSEIVYS
ncbi:hypothetical protein C0J45_16024 [Silurus meridionalis]|nr:hypothetical protein C0J45_16024 [Silurus meridionalis]